MTAKPKVMLIDNAKLMHGVVKARLGAEGLEVISALSGDAGLELAKQVAPDVILLDVEMPSPNGFEVCRRLKADPDLSNIPVIFLTGATSVEEKVRGLSLGATDYITKPFDTAELLARVRASLRIKSLVDLLARKAMIDGLTELWNRRYLDQRISEEMAHARRYRLPLSCVMLDVDRFKSVNDTFGHGFGDEVLRAVATLIQQTVRTEDIACRFGGEEFAIVAKNSDAPAAMQMAERLRAGIENTTFKCGQETVPVTCSFGVAELLEADDDVVDRADRALYLSKHSGRNKVTLFEPTANIGNAPTLAA